MISRLVLGTLAAALAYLSASCCCTSRAAAPPLPPLPKFQEIEAASPEVHYEK